jgi:cytochrome d ubiquinol oxidase subunit II
MSVVALIFVPVVLGYSAWAYWVFRGRLGGEDYGTPQARARGVLDRVAPERPDAPGAAH